MGILNHIHISHGGGCGVQQYTIKHYINAIYYYFTVFVIK